MKRDQLEDVVTTAIDPLIRALEGAMRRAHDRVRFEMPLYDIHVLNHVQKVGKLQGLAGVARSMGVRKEGLTNVVTSLVGRGFVVKLDPRQVRSGKRIKNEPLVLMLTDKGRRVVRAYRERLRSEVRTLLEPVNAIATHASERAAFARCLDALVYSGEEEAAQIENIEEN